MFEGHSVHLERAYTPTAQVKALVGALDQELSAHYPPEQRHGLALDAIITRLAAEASHAGLTLLRLETGTQQIAAIRFYRGHGFQPCEAFEPYTSMPPQSIANSVFLERQLSLDEKLDSNLSAQA